MTRDKIKLIWTWVDPKAPSGSFVTQSPEVLRELLCKGDSLLDCTERRLTSCFIDDYGWYPNHPSAEL